MDGAPDLTRDDMVSRMTRREVAIALIGFTLVTCLYILNGHWGTSANPDTIAVAIPAWNLAQTGSLDLSDIDAIRDNQVELERWYVFDKDGRIVSNRAPGLIALAYPSYVVFGRDGFSNAPATLVALLVTLAAVVLLWRIFVGEVGFTFGTAAAVVLAIGTTTWTVSSSELWPHGPGQLFAAIAVTALAGARYASSGFSFVGSILVRPVAAVFAAVTGVLEGIRLRRLRPVVRIAVTSALGVLAVIAYNRWLFGVWSVSGGYGDYFTSSAVDRFTVLGYLGNLTAVFFSPRHGVLTTSPVLGVAAVGAVIYRKRLSGWMKSAAWAGVAYLVLHAALNRASGGMAMFYRYPLEAIVMAGPVLLIGARGVWLASSRARLLLGGAAALSVLLQFMNAFLFDCAVTDPASGMCRLEAVVGLFG